MTHERMFRHEHAHKLEDPERERWLPVSEALARLSLAPGSSVADIGAGTGYFALPIARAIQPGGRVLAVDMQPEMLARLRERVGDLPITLVHGTADHTALPDACADLVLFANVWHEIDDTSAALVEARRILRPGGRIAIFDWRADADPAHGPVPEHRVSAAAALATLSSAGWRAEESVALGAYHYAILAEPAR